MFNIGAGEIVVILVAALIVLGPQRLPELARGLGKFLREFRRHTDEVRGVVEREFYRMDQEFQSSAPVTPAAAKPEEPRLLPPAAGTVSKESVAEPATEEPPVKPPQPS